jgi:NodT family efflux transporter outer membrane factor (OMF) lipoprotein
VLPWLDNTDSWTRSQTGENSGGSGQPVNLYRLRLDASWEIDLFGQNRENVKAATATLEADYASLHDAWVSLSAEVALTYLSLRTLQNRLDIAQKNLELRMDTLELLRSQYAAGLTNTLALNQAQYSVEQTRASIPTLRTNVEEALNALSILVGRVPGSLEEFLGKQKPLPKPEAVDLVGIPAEALRQRPDIRAAERRVMAQAARRRSAEKDLLPKFSLLGSIGLDSISSGSLFSNDSIGFSFGPRITLPFFHGGAIRKNIRVQSAREEQLLAAYEQAILSAVAEVRDALTANAQERERNASLKRGVEAARNAYEAAEDLYRHGLADFNNVILTQQALLSLEEEYAISEGQMTSNIVRLFKALGGGWEPLTAENL